MEEPLNSLSRQELDRLLESVRAQPPTVPTHCRRQRPGIARDGPGFDPTAPPSEPSLQQQRRQTARQFFGAMLLTLMLMGGCFGALLVQESYRQVGMGSPPPPVIFHPRLTGSGVEFVTDAAPTPEEQAQLCWFLDRLEPLLLPPRGLRLTARLLLGGRLLLDWL